MKASLALTSKYESFPEQQDQNHVEPQIMG